jgi:hypothetical protein
VKKKYFHVCAYEALCYEKKSFKAYVSRIKSQPLKMYDISPPDFAHHVRHANGWNDLGVRCGLETNERGYVRNRVKMLQIQEKVRNMRLDTDHFYGQQSLIPDDVFKTIVQESDCLNQVQKKCNISWEKILERIEYLCIDITHFKITKKHTIKRHNKVDAIDDETFKTLLKNNTTWRNLSIACGFQSFYARKFLAKRIEKLGLNTNHFDDDVIPSDKIFVVNSQYKDKREIKKRLIRDFDRAYECVACKNQAFTKSDGVLLWNNKEIVLQLEYKNGINNDNRLDNLEFLCPSCHSQTSTFCGANTKKRKAGQAWLEEGKTSHAPGSISSLLN